MRQFLSITALLFTLNIKTYSVVSSGIVGYHYPRKEVMNMNLNLGQIGTFIQNSRKEIGLTQAEMGERLNVSAQSVSNWERGVSHS